MSDISNGYTNRAEIKTAASELVERAKGASRRNDIDTARMYFGVAIGLFEEAHDVRGASRTRDIAGLIK